MPRTDDVRIGAVQESKRFDVAARVARAYQFDKWLRKKISKTAPTMVLPAFRLASVGAEGKGRVPVR